MLTDAGGWLQFPGGSSKVTLEASAGGNVATLSMAQGDLAALRLGTWWGELQYAYGGYNVGSLRFDFLVANGLGTGLGASAGSGSPLDCVVLDAAPLDIITVFAGSAAAPFLSLSPALQAQLGVSNVDDALLTLLRLVSTRPNSQRRRRDRDRRLRALHGGRHAPAASFRRRLRFHG